ncbi:alcohol oxidase-like protein [Xylariaceae sp. FL0016]|nr:alcohol oxidase-like protein [Xylariaceae sp. FL0016]
MLMNSILPGPTNYDDAPMVAPFLLYSQLAPERKIAPFYKSKKSELLGDREPTRSGFDACNIPKPSAEDLIPFMKKAETYHHSDPKDVHGKDNSTHQSKGTYSQIADLSDLESVNGVQRARRFIFPDSIRQDPAHGCLPPRLSSARVIRIVFDGKRAPGVMHQSSTKLIVLSCGACGTPQVLEQSGVGAKAILKRSKITPVVEVPGVGDGFEDHCIVSFTHGSDLAPNGTLCEQREADWVECPLITGKARRNDADVASLGPRSQEAWDKDSKENPERPLSLAVLVNVSAELLATDEQFFTKSMFTAYPYSRGHLNIKCPGLDDPVDFVFGLISDSEGIDVLTCRRGYEEQREIARRMKVYRGEVESCHPPLLSDFNSKPTQCSASPSIDTPNIDYSAADDAVIDQWTRDRMVSLEKEGVMDENLGVCGVLDLKVADLTIRLGNVAAHTNATSLVVGERAADVFIKELRLK